tara:strand:- start:10330 stop:11415 length:1086 start_codon:yes stop_codon:yes gene_type:complete
VVIFAFLLSCSKVTSVEGLRESQVHTSNEVSDTEDEREDNLFFKAVNSGDIEAVCEHIFNGQDPFVRDQKGNIAVSVALKNDNYEVAEIVVKAMVKHNKDRSIALKSVVATKDPLYLAIVRGQGIAGSLVDFYDTSKYKSLNGDYKNYLDLIADSKISEEIKVRIIRKLAKVSEVSDLLDISDKSVKREALKASMFATLSEMKDLLLQINSSSMTVETKEQLINNEDVKDLFNCRIDKVLTIVENSDISPFMKEYKGEGVPPVLLFVMLMKRKDSYDKIMKYETEDEERLIAALRAQIRTISGSVDEFWQREAAYSNEYAEMEYEYVSNEGYSSSMFGTLIRQKAKEISQKSSINSEDIHR